MRCSYLRIRVLLGILILPATAARSCEDVSDAFAALAVLPVTPTCAEVLAILDGPGGAASGCNATVGQVAALDAVRGAAWAQAVGRNASERLFEALCTATCTGYGIVPPGCELPPPPCPCDVVYVDYRPKYQELGFWNYGPRCDPRNVEGGEIWQLCPTGEWLRSNSVNL